MSGNEVSWEEVRETVDAQIDVVKASGETDDSVVVELTSLRERLDVLQRTGAVRRLLVLQQRAVIGVSA